MADPEFDTLDDSKLTGIGRAISRMSLETPPPDLVTRTLARISERCQPVKRVFILLRPIYHPLARLGAAAAIILALSPLTDIATADKLGAKIESRIIGRQVTDRIEMFVDGLLVRHGPALYTQDDLDSLIGIPRPVFSPVRPAAKRGERI